MKLLKLVTKNFKKLGNFSADFTDGLNVIVGENAQGKSTLLQAIEAALFGVTVVPGKKENIPTWGQTNFSLELHFAVDSSIYVLTRSKSTAKLQRYGLEDDAEELVANGNTPVTAFIEQLLGLTAKDFNLFVQSKQGETSGVLTFGATALNQKVEEFAGVSLIDSIMTRARALATAEKTAADACSVSAEELDHARIVLEAAEISAQEATSARYVAETNLDNFPLAAMPPAVSSSALQATQRIAQRAESALREAEVALGHKREAVVTAEQALAECGDLVDIDSVTAASAEKGAVLRQKRARLADVKEQLASAIRAEAEHEQAKTELAAIEPVNFETLEEQERTHKHYAEDAARTRELIAVDKSKLAALHKLEKDATCPTCGTALAEHDPEQLAEEIATLEKQISDLGVGLSLATAGEAEGIKQLTTLRKRIEQRSAKQAEVEKWAAKLVDASVVSDLRGEASSLESVIEELQGEVATLKAKADAGAEANERRAAAERRLNQAHKNVASAEDAVVEARQALVADAPTDEQIAAARAAEDAYAQAKAEWDRRYQAAQHAVEMAVREDAVAANALADAQRRVEVMESTLQKAKGHEMVADRAGRLARFLADRRVQYLRDVWETVMAVASRQVKAATRGEITRISNEGGEFTFEEDGVLAPIASASGAQKAFIGSAVRIGLARTLYGRDSLLIFDEPTESMSERNASGLAASLAGSANQLLLITHREQDQGLAANIIQVGA